MIAICNPGGNIIKVVPDRWQGGYHHIFGFVTEASRAYGIRKRLKTGLKLNDLQFDFEFSIAASDLHPIKNCQIVKLGHYWEISSGQRSFLLREVKNTDKFEIEHSNKTISNRIIPHLLVFLFCPLALLLAIKEPAMEQTEQKSEPVMVRVFEDKIVPIPFAKTETSPKKAPVKISEKSLPNYLEFLNLLGKKEISKVSGGIPTNLNSSNGAGDVGKRGSGGEFLAGLGEGLKRTSVGNTGTEGFGGVGTKGMGGGHGGYGTVLIAAGEGPSLANGPLTREENSETGLDRAVIQATIEKYLSQVKNCYEQGLRRNNTLGGLVTMSFEINPDGNLNFAKVAKSTLGDVQVEQCMSQRMLDWRFPSPKGKVSVKITYPFLLRSLNS